MTFSALIYVLFLDCKGDTGSDCDDIKASQCYDQSSIKECCSTCKDKETDIHGTYFRYLVRI